MMNARLLAPALGFAALLSAAFSSSAALAACPVIPGAPVLQPGAELVSVEGPVTDINLVESTVTVLGTCINVPVGFLVDTSADGVGDFTLNQIMTLGSRSPIGGTIIGDGLATVDATGNLSITATALYFEYAENVIVGPLVSVDVANGTFLVGGTTVQMNVDALMPADLLDLGFNPITIDQMVGFEGTVVGAQGWFEGGVLQGTVVETEVVQVVVGVDTVVIERAQLRASRGQLEVRGLVSFQTGTGALAATLNVDPGCDGINVISTPVTPDVGGGTYRYLSANNAFPTNPGTVCVTSPLGGTASRAIDLR